MQQDIDNDTQEVKTTDLCKRIKDKVVDEIENNTIVSYSAQIKSKVILDSITTYNTHLTTQKGSDKSNLCKILQHQRSDK